MHRSNSRYDFGRSRDDLKGQLERQNPNSKRIKWVLAIPLLPVYPGILLLVCSTFETENKGPLGAVHKALTAEQRFLNQLELGQLGHWSQPS